MLAAFKGKGVNLYSASRVPAFNVLFVTNQSRRPHDYRAVSYTHLTLPTKRIV